MRVLVTRPLPDATRTSAALRELGHQVVVEPLLSVESIAIRDWPSGPFAALAITSANAARVGGASDMPGTIRRLPLYAVGRHSAEAAHAAGFRHVVAAAGDAEALATLLAQSLKYGNRVLHLAGEEIARDLGEVLRPVAIRVERLALYRMRAADTLGAAAEVMRSGAVDAALHFSPRSAATFVALAEKASVTDGMRGIRHLCLSPAVAAPLQGVGARTEVARRPEEEALIALLES
jgi:uroporphyrinogen-III synthase